MLQLQQLLRFAKHANMSMLLHTLFSLLSG